MHNAPTAADAGIVTNHARTILPATPHRTAENLFEEPTPKSEEDVTWVVLMGAPMRDAVKITPAVALCDAKPCTGLILRIFCPIVFMIFQPPLSVPNIITPAQATLTQAGM